MNMNLGDSGSPDFEIGNYGSIDVACDQAMISSEFYIKSKQMT